MISLVLAMVWARRGQAVTLALLALFAVAAAVAAPAYLRAVDRAVAAGQVRTAVPDERGFEVSGLQNDRNSSELEPDGEAINFTDIGTALIGLPGFDYVYAAEYPTIGIEPTVLVRSRFVYRQDACPHLSMVGGRCLIGEGEVVIGEQTARRLSLAAGDPVTLTFATFSSDPQTPRFEAGGAPKPLTVVGVYRRARSRRDLLGHARLLRPGLRRPSGRAGVHRLQPRWPRWTTAPRRCRSTAGPAPRPCGWTTCGALRTGLASAHRDRRPARLGRHAPDRHPAPAGPDRRRPGRPPG